MKRRKIRSRQYRKNHKSCWLSHKDVSFIQVPYYYYYTHTCGMNSWYIANTKHYSFIIRCIAWSENEHIRVHSALHYCCNIINNTTVLNYDYRLTYSLFIGHSKRNSLFLVAFNEMTWRCPNTNTWQRLWHSSHAWSKKYPFQ